MAGKTSEIAAVEDLPGPLDIGGSVITAAALHTQRATARYLTERRGADCILTVKANRASLLEGLKRSPVGAGPHR